MTFCLKKLQRLPFTFLAFGSLGRGGGAGRDGGVRGWGVGAKNAARREKQLYGLPSPIPDSFFIK